MSRIPVMAEGGPDDGEFYIVNSDGVHPAYYRERHGSIRVAGAYVYDEYHRIFTWQLPN